MNKVGQRKSQSLLFLQIYIKFFVKASADG